MAKFVKEKRIMVKSYGHLHLLGGISGPIKTPILLPVTKVLSLINTNADVYEVLDNGAEIKLDSRNYNTKNSTPVKVAKKETLVSAVKAEVKKETFEAKAVEAPVEAKKEEEKKEEVKTFNNNKNNNKNQKK